MNRIIFDAEELAIYLGVSKDLIYKLSRNGAIPYFRVGQCYRYEKDKIDEWVAQGGTASLGAS